MKNKKKIIIIISLIILFFVIGIIASQIKKKNKSYNSLDDFDDIKELVEYYGCDYKKMKNSEEKDFSKDIYLTFKEDTIDNDGKTARFTYETLIKLISQKLEYINYRIIDESRNLTVRVMFDENKNGYYTINNLNNYFDNLESLYNINNKKEEKINKVDIVSTELQNIINNDWIKKKINLGNKTATCENYDIYWNNGYKIRTINNKIYNIIFTKNYSSEILKGIKVGMTNEEIKNVLGNPTYENNTEIEIIGYKLEKMYAFFSNGEISIYRPDEYNEEDNKKFASLVTKLFEDKDYNTFLSALTELYPDYSTYTKEENYINIKYPLKGFEISFGKNIDSGITIYNNFNGNITNNISIDDIKENKKIPTNTHINLQTNLVFSEESYRTTSDYLSRNPYDDLQEENGSFARTNKYTVYYNQQYSEFIFYSKNRETQDFQIRLTTTNGIYKISDNLFVYGVKNNGLFIINADNGQINKIVDSNSDCEITKIENNIIYYDDTQINIE